MCDINPQKFGLLVITLVLVWGSVPVAACTSFCFDTPGGPVFGANLDLRWGDGLVFVNRRGLAKEGYMLNSEGEPARWNSRYGSVTFNLVGIEMPWSGMNEAGLVVAGMQLLVTAFPIEDRRFPMSSATWTQYLLDTCTTIDEVIAKQDSIRLRGDAVHFLVADASGASVIVEFLEGETVLYSGEDLPVRALANATYSECLRFMENGQLPEFNPGRSAQRVAAAHEWTGRFEAGHEFSGTDWALGVLTKAVIDPKKWWKQIFSSPYTRWSVAYDVAQRQIYFQTVDHTPVRSFDFSHLDFSCTAPQLMLDVNAELEGALESSLQEYDAEMNFRFARTFLDRWGIELDEDQVRELTGFLESYPCGR